MEESSEKRRERLHAMRVEASSQSQPFSPPSSSGQSLSNPLINSSDAGERTPQAPRFDYYTDPTAAFSGSKKRHPNSSPDAYSSPIRSASPLSYPTGKGNKKAKVRRVTTGEKEQKHNGGPRNYHVPDAQRHDFQFQTSQSPDQSPWRSPVQFQSPLSGHMGGTPPGYIPPIYTPNPNSCGRSSGGSPGHDQRSWRSPVQFQSPLSGHMGETPPGYTPPIYTPNPNSWGRSSGGSPGHGFQPNYSSRGHGLRSPPNFGHRGGHSPHSNSGRGSGWQSRGGSSNPRPGWGGGRGDRPRPRRRCSKPNDPRHFYKAVMKDPWRKLKPIVGKLVRISGPGSWLPKSIAAPKRAKVIESGSKSQLSLAESLALSLEEAIDDV